MNEKQARELIDAIEKSNRSRSLTNFWLYMIATPLWLLFVLASSSQ